MNKKQILHEISEMETSLAKLKAELQKPETPEPWKPEEGENFFYVNAVGEVGMARCKKGSDAGDMVDVDNCFDIPGRANQVAEKFRRLLKLEKLHDMFCPDYVPDWNKADAKYAVFYNHNRRCWEWGEAHTTESTAAFFDSEETAKKVCELLNKEECNSECK